MTEVSCVSGWRCGRGNNLHARLAGRYHLLMGFDVVVRVAAGVWVIVLAVLALTVSPFLTAAVLGGAAAGLIEHVVGR